MDAKDWSAMRHVFADGVLIDTTEAGGQSLEGADEFMVFLADVLDGATTVHQGHMPRDRPDLRHPRDRDLGPERHRHLAERRASRRARALPRDLREDGRRVEDQVIEAHPRAR